LLISLGAPFAHALDIDLKTPTEEHADLVHIQYGAAFFLVHAGFDILELGEDYAVWIKNFSRTDT
jgi:hypothetical protein